MRNEYLNNFKIRCLLCQPFNLGNAIQERRGMIFPFFIFAIGIKERDNEKIDKNVSLGNLFVEERQIFRNRFCTGTFDN